MERMIVSLCRILTLCYLLQEALACDGTDLGKISKVLEEVEDYDSLASRLGIEISQVKALSATCTTVSITPAQCLRRMLVRTYCDLQGLVEIEYIAENIAKVLDALYKPEQASKLRQMYPKKGVQQCSGETECENIHYQDEFEQLQSHTITSFFLFTFAEECIHDRDYLRLVIVIICFLATCALLYRFGDSHCGKAFLAVLLGMFMPFFLYSLIFYYPLFFFPCYCFIPSILYVVSMLLFAIAWLNVLLILYLIFVCMDCLNTWIRIIERRKKMTKPLYLLVQERKKLDPKSSEYLSTSTELLYQDVEDHLPCLKYLWWVFSLGHRSLLTRKQPTQEDDKCIKLFLEKGDKVVSLGLEGRQFKITDESSDEENKDWPVNGVLEFLGHDEEEEQLTQLLKEDYKLVLEKENEVKYICLEKEGKQYKIKAALSDEENKGISRYIFFIKYIVLISLFALYFIAYFWFLNDYFC